MPSPSFALANKLGLDLGKSAAKDIKYAQETVDAWLDGMTTAISNAQKRKAQQKQEAKQETTTAQKAEQEANQEARKGTVQELELALEATRKHAEFWKSEIGMDTKEGLTSLAELHEGIYAEAIQREKDVETMLAKAKKGDALSSAELSTLNDTYDDISGFPFTEDWKAFREQGQKAETKVSYSKNDSWKMNSFGLAEYSEDERNRILRDPKNRFAETETDIIDFINGNVVNRNKPYARLHCGAISSELGSRIQRDTGHDLTGASLVIDSYFENSHSDTKKEQSRGQQAITPEIVAKLPNAIANYEKVFYDGKVSDGRDAFRFIVDIDGEKRAVEYYSKSRNLLTLQTMYGWNNKKNLSVTSDAKAPDRTSKTTNGLGSFNKSLAENKQDVNKNFSLNDAVEETRDLIAVHNLSGEQLANTIALGGFPMPSIAIMKASQGHERYGDISVLFNKDTIDPQLLRSNKVYGSDAWTPTFPKIEYETDSNITSKVSKHLHNLLNRVDEYFRTDLSQAAYVVEDTLNRYGGEEGVVQAALDNYGLKAAYLEEQDKHITPVTKQETVGKPVPAKMEDKYIKAMDILGVDTAEQIGKLVLKDVREQHGTELEAVFPGITDSAIRLSGTLNRIQTWLKGDNGVITRTVTDMAATHETIDNAIDKEQYAVWVRNLFRGVEKSKGLYNGKDKFTSAGNRRSFSALHYEYNLENIVRAMKVQSEKRQNAWGSSGLFAVATKDYKSIGEIRADKARLTTASVEEYQKQRDAFSNRLQELAHEIEDKKAYNPFIAFDDAIQVLLEAVQRGKTVSSMKKILEQYKMLNVKEDTAARLYALAKEVENMPTEYFEAKPQRAVGMDEVKLVVVPKGRYGELENQLSELGIPVETYAPNVEGDRTRVLNGATAQKYMFATDDFGLPDGHYDYSKSFAEQIEDYKNGRIPKGDTLVVGATPDVFQKIGLSALPTTINTTHVGYALNGTKDFDHHLGESLLKQLPEAIQHPVAIMTSGTRPNSSIVAMLEIRHNGKQVVTPVVIDGFGKQNGLRIDSNAISSVYGKDYSISNVLFDAIERENNGVFSLFYLNTKKATSLLQGAKASMPKMPATHDGGFIHTLADTNSPVKSKISARTDTQQFKRWFGRSVVRNADGTPMILYHGTAAYFTVFERGDIGYHVGTKAQAEDRIAGVEGGHIMELYASIQNPLYAAMDFGDWHGQNVAEMLIETERFEDFDNRAEIEERLSEIAQMDNQQEADTALRKYLQDLGYDGIVYENRWEGEGESYIVFESSQLKSATDNIGLFDRNNPDIRYALDKDFLRDTVNAIDTQALEGIAEVGSVWRGGGVTEKAALHQHRRSGGDTGDKVIPRVGKAAG